MAAAKKVFESGKWTVLRDVDKMTDKVICTGILGSDYQKQLTRDTFFISISGGITSVTLRFNDGQAEPLRLSSKSEKDVRAVIIRGSDFEKLKASTRLRGVVTTLINRSQELDLDLTGVGEALLNIEQGCPSSVLATSTAKPAEPTIELTLSCSADLIGKMQRAGVTMAQVAQVCGK